MHRSDLSSGIVIVGSVQTQLSRACTLEHPEYIKIFYVIPLPRNGAFMLYVGYQVNANTSL